MNRTRALRAIAVLALTGIVLVGCAGSPATSPTTGGLDTVSTPDVGEVPSFQGAWSDLFTSVYSSPTTTDAQREILSDGAVSAAEYARLRNDFAHCLEDLGLAVELHEDGGFAIDESRNLNESQISGDAVPRCEARTVGSVGLLYEQIRRNPQQQDEATVVVECLKDAGAVGASYTPAEYRRDLDAYTGLDWDSGDVRTCTADPLGLVGGSAPTPGS